MPITLSTPLSLYSIPVVWLTTFYPMNMKFNLINKTVGYNNLQPRANTQRLAESGAIPKDIAARAQRMEGAHLNGNEMLPLWIGAVLAGNQAGLPQETLNTVSAAYIITRLLYNYIYINQSSEAVSWLRTGVWFTGLSFPMYLFIKAANALRSQSLL